MRFSLARVAEMLGLDGSGFLGEVSGWSVDSRTVQRGDLFIALRGPNHDGHAHVAESLAKGAVAAIVDREVAASGALLHVRNTQQALERLGKEARQAWGGEVIAVTGSAGKTTTKDVIAAMLGTRFAVGKTVGNLNNHVGVPLSILRLPEQSRHAVLEMGMNHAGEIAALTRIARPQVGVVTNVGYAHIENFHSIEEIAAAKGELIDGLEADGTAVLNADDARVARMAHRGRVVTYGMSESADVRARDVEYSLEGVRFSVDGTRIESQLSGRHGVSNLLAGIAVASVYGIDVAELRSAAAALEPGAMRGRHFEKDGILHINDCYNSNPDAARAMIEVLADTPAKRRVVVLGEMLELGAWSEKLHREVGRYVAGSGIDVLVGIRGAAVFAVDSAVDAGFAASAASFFEEPAEAGEFLKGVLRAGDVVLWKGSRGTKVEVALQRFLGEE